jgi:hypothetical protein
MSIKFKDALMGTLFEDYGDMISNYDYPKICLFKKIGPYTVVEIENGKETMQCLIDENRKIDPI